MNLDHTSCYRAISARDVRFDGQFFTGVRTTGIYCRPVCPARTPKSSNVEFYPTAAAAQQAGFRPCLRCRPETAPGSRAWQGTSSTVSRALAMIEMDGLNESDIGELAERLGVGGRQLRRLFQQHLGATPIAVVQTRRLLLAKQLIHETQLPMTEVAFASGFRSIRRFNEAFASAYDGSPSELRRSRQGKSASTSMIRLSLGFRPPYDWQAMLDFFRQRAICGVEAVVDNRYQRTIDLEGSQGILTVEPAGEQSLALTIQVTKLSVLPTVIARVRRVFDLDADPSAIASHFAACPVMSRLAAARPGLRVPGAWDGFELAIRAVLGQQVTVAAAVQLAEKMTASYGARLAAPVGNMTHLFPTAAALADADLKTLGMPRARAKTLSAVARASIANPRFFDGSDELSESVSRFRTVTGIGEWTAQYIAMRHLHEPDAFPATDVGLQRATAGHLGSKTHKMPAAELLEYADAWRPWRANAAQYLWSSLDG